MKKHLIGSLVLTSSLLISATPVFAVGSPMPRLQQRMDYVEKRQMNTEVKRENVERMIESRCKTLDQRSTAVINRYDKGYPTKVENYQKMMQKAQDVVSRAKQSGKDTTKLEAVLTTLNEKIRTFDQQTKAVIAQLKVAEQYACGESQGQYKTEIMKARELAQTAQKTMVDIQTYYQTTVRPEIVALWPEERPAKSAQPAQRQGQMMGRPGTSVR
jgi:hypothetical protein